MTLGDFATLMVALATTGSLIYISRQVNVTRLQAKGQFLLALDAQFKEFNRITLELANTREVFTPQSADWRDIFGYMGVFERINIMVEDKILDIALVDRLYGFRLIAILANDEVYKMVSLSGAEWQDFILLCRLIAERRRRVHVAAYDQAFIDRANQLTTDSVVPLDQWATRLSD